MKFFLLISIVCVGLAFFSGISLSAKAFGEVHSCALWEFLSVLVLGCIAFKAISVVCNKLAKIFIWRPDVKKGLEYLQEAFSGMLVKNHYAAEKALLKAKKHLGEVPLVSWLEGQLSLINNDMFKAKSIFFSLSSRETKTALGAYSLSQLSLQNGSAAEAISSLEATLQVYPSSQEIIKKIISLGIKSNNFDIALKYLKDYEGKNKDKIKSIIYYEKWKQLSIGDDLKKAYEASREIVSVALSYADWLSQNGDGSAADKVLLRSFEEVSYPEILRKYLYREPTEELKRAKKALKRFENSWIAQYEAARIFVKHELYEDAFEHAIQAYSAAPYTFVADVLLDCSAQIDDKDISLDLSKAKRANFIWKCSCCHHEYEDWFALCPNCEEIATLEYEEKFCETALITTSQASVE
ncbi:MAG: hypothetical protein IJA14_04535 [Alphaproteobacteria bacterium]|nr:hypothetical protein [Alphaproteobacteria bacterium]